LISLDTKVLDLYCCCPQKRHTKLLGSNLCIQYVKYHLAYMAD
jgi:hypothetical protein